MYMLRYKVSALIRDDVGSQLRLAVDEPARSLGEDLQVDFLRGNLVLTRTDRRILAEGLLRSALVTECMLCLTSFHLPLQIRFEELFALTAGPHVTDPDYIIEPDGTINLTHPLREHILLAQPIQPICRPGCKGLCVQCGKNLNEGPCECNDESIDSRLAALKALL